MRNLIQTFKFLTRRERVLVGVSVLIRFGLVTFDLIGIFLVGVVVSLISGTVIANSSPLTKILNWFHEVGFSNGYVAIAGVAIVFFITKGLLSVTLNYLTASYVGRIEAAKGATLYARLLHSKLQQIEKYSQQETLQGLTLSVNAAFAQTITIASSILGEIALLVGVSMYLAFTNFLLFLGVAVFFSFVGLLMQMTIGRASGRSATRAYRGGLVSQGLILNSLANFRQLVTSKSSESFQRAFTQSRIETAHQNAVYSTITTLPRYITEIAVMIGVGLLVLQRSNDTGMGIPAATIAVFLAGLFRIVASMLPLQAGLSALKRVSPEAEMAFALFEDLKSPPSRGAVPISKNPISIKAEALSFSYTKTGPPVFSGVSFEIPAGSYVAIIGKSGEGKSTLADLILGLRDPSGGTILLNGLLPGDLTSSAEGVVGYVPQTTSLFPGTLLENLLFEIAPSQYDKNALDEAIFASNLTEFVAGLSDGLQTMIGPGGVELSGGQAQRVGLARALYTQPSLLVLDEATSALDLDTEKAIHTTLLGLRGTVTCLVIAHRPQTLREADFILKVEKATASLLPTLR